MKRIFFASWIYGLSGLLLFLTGCNTVTEKDLQSEIDQVTTKLVPDQRMTICRASIKANGHNAFILRGETTDTVAKSEIIKTLSNHSIELTDSLIMLPDTIKNEKYMGLVTLSVINLRRNPSHTAELVSQSIMGTPVMILEKADSWLLVQTPDKYIAWTTESSVNPMRSAEIKNWKNSDRIIFLENSGWIYIAPSSTSQVIGDLVEGAYFKKQVRQEIL